MHIPPPETAGGLHFDVAINGGGINGASAAQHLTASGYSEPAPAELAAFEIHLSNARRKPNPE